MERLTGREKVEIAAFTSFIALSWIVCFAFGVICGFVYAVGWAAL